MEILRQFSGAPRSVEHNGEKVLSRAGNGYCYQSRCERVLNWLFLRVRMLNFGMVAFLDLILLEMGAMRAKAPARYASRNAANGIWV